MRVRVQRRGLVPAVVVAVLGTVALYVGSTTGLAAWHASRSAPESGVGYLPSVVANVPPTVPTTDVHGPPGSVALVYAGTKVEQGLTGSLENPWITVSSQTGDYRALDLPDLPDPTEGGVSVSPDGATLAWAGPSGVVVYDAVTGEMSTFDVDGADGVGDFAAEGSMLAAHTTDGLTVVETGSGEVLAQAAASAEQVDRAVWRPDGSAIDHVSDGGLVTLSIRDGDVTTQPTTIPDEAQLAWSPSGDRLADLHDVSGSNRLFLSPLRPDGTLAEPSQVDTSGLSLQYLLGFSGERTVTTDAFVLESGSVERVLDVPLDNGSRYDLTTLPPPGENWVDTATMAVATDTLARGSFAWDTPPWPWSHRARLGACTLFMVFLFGLYVTRRPRRG